MIHVIDNALPNIREYSDEARRLDFRTYDFGHVVFHGIGVLPIDSLVPQLLRSRFGLTPSLSFVRRSPLGQVEPHFIHTDVDMGEWSCLLYLNDSPDEGDGTNFWTHLATGKTGSSVPHEYSEDGRHVHLWSPRRHVAAKLNRMVLFTSEEFHSRAIFENYGDGDGSRLVQVTFGTGDLASALRRAA